MASTHLHGRLLAADGIEGVVGAQPAGQLLHALHHVLVLGVDGVGGAELARVAQLVVEQVAGDDGLGAGELGALHHVEPDAAAADHQHAMAPASTLAWRMTAPTPVATLQPMMAACVHGRSLRTDTTCSAGHTTYSENVPMRAIWLTGSPLSFTRAVPSCMRQRGVSLWPMHRTVRPRRAVAAVPAVRAEREDDVVALLDVADAGAQLGDDAGGLVAQHHRQRQRPVAVHDVPVAHAHAGGLDLHPHLAGLGPLLLEVEDLQRLVDFGQDGGSHRLLLSSNCKKMQAGAAPGQPQSVGVTGRRRTDG